MAERSPRETTDKQSDSFKAKKNLYLPYCHYRNGQTNKWQSLLYINFKDFEKAFETVGIAASGISYNAE